MGGWGEARISDAYLHSLIIKWTYLHSLTHNVGTSAGAVTCLLKWALTSSIMDPLVYCTSLVDWGKRMGLTLHQAPTVTIPIDLFCFLAPMHTAVPRPIYSDGCFAVDASLLVTFTQSPTDLTRNYRVVATFLLRTDYQQWPCESLSHQVEHQMRITRNS